MNTQAISSNEASLSVPTEAGRHEQCENFAQLAMQSPESQLDATRSKFDELQTKLKKWEHRPTKEAL